MQSYYNNIMQKCEQLPDASPELKLEIFTAGLPRYIRFYLKLNKPATIEEALEQAKSSEAVGPDKDDQSHDIKEIQQSLDNLIGKFERKGPGVSAFEDGQYYRSQKQGSLVKDSSTDLVNNEMVPRSEQVCTACYKKGHNFTVCFKLNGYHQYLAPQQGNGQGTRGWDTSRFSNQTTNGLGRYGSHGGSRTGFNSLTQKRNNQGGNGFLGRPGGYGVGLGQRPFGPRPPYYPGRPAGQINDTKKPWILLLKERKPVGRPTKPRATGFWLIRAHSSAIS